MYHQIFVGEDITLENGGIFAKQILEKVGVACSGENDKIVILINSVGGSIRGLQTIMAAIKVAKNSGRKTVTVNLSVSCSSPAILFLQGDERYVMPGSELVFHEPIFTINERTRYNKIVEEMPDYEANYKMFVEEMTKNSNLSYTEVEEKIKMKDWVVKEEDSVKLGMSHGIIYSI